MPWVVAVGLKLELGMEGRWGFGRTEDWGEIAR